MELAQLLPPQTLDSDPVLDFEADLELAARELDIGASLVQRLKHAEREITVNIPAMRSDGTSINVACYRVQHSRVLGPSLGPVVLSPSAHPAGLRLSAAIITMQAALLGLRTGGAAGAIVCESAQLGETELRRIIREYVEALRDDAGALRDVVAVTGGEWLLRTVRNADYRVHGHACFNSVVGDDALKPAVASATIAMLRRALRREDLSGLRVAIQGIGGSGRILLETLAHERANVIAVADRSGAVICPDGLNVKTLSAYVSESGVVYGYPQADTASNADALESDCDLLILAAAGQQIGSHNAAKIRARTILELKHNAVSVPYERLGKDCLVIPYLLAGCPQVAVWAYEWQRGFSASALDSRQAAAEAGKQVVDTFEGVRELAERNRLPLARACMTFACRRLWESHPTLIP